MRASFAAAFLRTPTTTRSSTEATFVAPIRHHLDVQVNAMLARLEQEPGVTSIRAFFAEVVELAEDASAPPGGASETTVEPSARDTSIRAEIEGYRDRLTRAFARSLEAAAAAGEIAPGDREMRVRMLTTFALGRLAAVRGNPAARMEAREVAADVDLILVAWGASLG